MVHAVKLIESADALNDLANRLKGAAALGIDTEFVRERSYQPRLELVQIAAPDGEIAIVDYGRIGRLDPDPLAPLLADPSILKVFYAAEQDLEMLHMQTGVLPDPIWDAQLALDFFAHAGRRGYASVVESLLGERPKSGESLTDWSRRPLAPEQLHYAAEDVRYLLALHDLERKRLEGLGRVAWAEEEFQELRTRVEAAEKRRKDENNTYQRIKGWQKLRPRGLAILRELAAWRQREAERRDRPAGTVIRDDLLVEIARRAPASVGELSRLRGIATGLVERHAAALTQAIEAGKSVPASALPPPAPEGVDLDDRERALVWLLQAVLQVIAVEKQISASLVTSSAEVQRLVFAKSHGEPSDDLRLLRGWRRQAVGEELLAVLDGRRRVAWDPDRRTLRLEEL